MLTTDLMRVAIRRGAIQPRYIDATDAVLLARAAERCALCEAHRDRRRESLDDAIGDLVGDAHDFAVTRGLAKLLDDRSEWGAGSPIDPVELRQRVFEAAASAWPVGTRRSALHPVSRDDVLARVADDLGMTPGQVDAAMYGDLKAEQRMIGHRPLAPDALLHRYNLALAQGVVLRADELRIEVDADRASRLRELFRHLKFRQLMHRTTKTADGAWRVVVDGPASLFACGQRYGLQLALFVPAVMLLDRWRIEADVRWRQADETLTFSLSPEDGLVSHLRSKGTWVSQEEQVLTQRIDDHRSGWRVRRRAKVIDLGGEDVLVPDFTVEHEDGRRAYVEIVGFWRRGWLERRVELLRRHGPPNLVLCVSRRLVTDRSDLEGLDVVEFAEVIALGRFLEAVEGCAV